MVQGVFSTNSSELQAGLYLLFLLLGGVGSVVFTLDSRTKMGSVFA